MNLQNLNQIPSKKTHKILWTVIGVLLLVVIAGSMAWWQMVKQTSSTNKFVPHYDAKQNCYMVYEDLCAQSDSTASWQTYTNRQYAFEFKYPNDWIVKNEKDLNDDVVNVYEKNVQKLQFSIRAGTLTGQLGKMIREVGGRKAYELCIFGCGIHTRASNEGDEIVIPETPKSNSYVDINYLYSVPPYTKHELDTISNILSTFKFLDEVRCGGFAGFPCPSSGFDCKPEGNYPDAMTVCTKKP